MNKKEAEELLNDFIEYGWKPEVHNIHDKIKDSFIKERFSKAENLPISDVVGRSELLICGNCRCNHSNNDYEGYCSQSCFDGIK